MTQLIAIPLSRIRRIRMIVRLAKHYSGGHCPRYLPIYDERYSSPRYATHAVNSNSPSMREIRDLTEKANAKKTSSSVMANMTT